MKKLVINIIIGCIMAASFTANTFAQAPMLTTEEGGKMPAKFDTASVPKVVTRTYLIEYPAATYDGWYGYPAFSDESDWYGYNRDNYTNQYPEYYIVEFNEKTVPHKVMYHKTGRKVATHKKMASIPKAVTDALSKGTYKSWTILKENEELLRESDKMKMYKIQVKKGTEEHVLYFHADGKLVKDKKIKS